MDFKDILINLGSRPDHIKMEECMQSVARIAKRQNSDKVDNDASNVASKQPRVEPKVTTKGRLTSKLWTVNEVSHSFAFKVDLDLDTNLNCLSTDLQAEWPCRKAHTFHSLE